MPEPIIFAPEAETERSGLPPRMDIRAEPEAFGVGIAKAREEQAAAIGVGGEKIFNRAIELQHVNNETVKNNLAVQSAAELGALRADYDNKKGLDAQQGYDDYIKGVQAVRAKYTALAPNPDVKAMLDNELSMRIVRDSDFAGAHKSNEWQS